MPPGVRTGFAAELYDKWLNAAKMYDFIDYLNLVYFIVGIIAIIRYNKIDRRFIPFLFFIWIGCLNDILSYILVARGHYTIINNNIYTLFESLLLVWFFEKIGMFKKRIIPFTTALFFLLAWVLEFLIFGSLPRMTVYFRIIYAFATVLMSISAINAVLLLHRTKLTKNPLFLICCGFIVYYTIRVLINAFWLYGLTKSNYFLKNIFYLMMVINFLTNVIYAIAILRMSKEPFSLQTETFKR